MSIAHLLHCGQSRLPNASLSNQSRAGANEAPTDDLARKVLLSRLKEIPMRLTVWNSPAMETADCWASRSFEYPPSVPVLLSAQLVNDATNAPVDSRSDDERGAKHLEGLR